MCVLVPCMGGVTLPLGTSTEVSCMPDWELHGVGVGLSSTMQGFGGDRRERPCEESQGSSCRGGHVRCVEACSAGDLGAKQEVKVPSSAPRDP